MDTIEALKSIQTLARVGSDSDDIEAARKLFGEILSITGKALPKRDDGFQKRTKANPDAPPRRS